MVPTFTVHRSTREVPNFRDMDIEIGGSSTIAG
jgi:hypothetical protein